MLTEYALTNFKAFAGEQRVKLKPITLIYGQNSSGKSSLLQSLLLLKQTIESSENPEMLLLPKGNLVDLGGYREFINGHDVRKPFVFEVRLPVPKGEHVLPGLIQKTFDNLGVTSLGLRVEMVHDAISSAAKLGGLELFIGGQSEPVMSFKSERAQTKQRYPRRFAFRVPSPGIGVGESGLRLSSLNSQHPFFSALWDIARAQLQPEVVNELLKRREFLTKRLEKLRPPELVDIDDAAKRPVEKRMERELKAVDTSLEKLKGYSLTEALTDMEKSIAKTFLPCRNFLPVTLVREEGYEARGFFGHLEYGPGMGYDLASVPGLVIFTANWLQSALESSIYIGPLRDYPERHYIFSGNLTEQVGKSGKMVPDVLFKRRDLLDQVNQQLETFGLGYELKVSSVNDRDSDLQDVFALRLFDKHTSVHASILDVGFGISQVLPIIVQSMLSRRKTLIIEQPEIHLHPKLQADLGTLIATCSKEPFNNQFMIETHSQHLILRLQRLIRQGKLTPDDVSVIYVDRSATGSQCVELRLDKDGDFIDNWPQGFFEEGYNEIFS
jgi:hypothetical protein